MWKPLYVEIAKRCGRRTSRQELSASSFTCLWAFASFGSCWLIKAVIYIYIKLINNRKQCDSQYFDAVFWQLGLIDCNHSDFYRKNFVSLFNKDSERERVRAPEKERELEKKLQTLRGVSFDNSVTCQLLL